MPLGGMYHTCPHFDQLKGGVGVDRMAERWVREIEGDEDYELYVEQPED